MEKKAEGGSLTVMSAISKGSVQPESELHVYETIIRSLLIGYSMVEPDGLIVDFNSAAQDMTGCNREDVIGKPHPELFLGTSDPEACSLMKSAI
jgi:PAS domain S-box-containing protein